MAYISNDIPHKDALWKRNEFSSPENVESGIHFWSIEYVLCKKRDFFIQARENGESLPERNIHPRNNNTTNNILSSQDIRKNK